MDDEPFIIAALIAEDGKRRLEKKSTEEIISVDHLGIFTCVKSLGEQIHKNLYRD